MIQVWRSLGWMQEPKFWHRPAFSGHLDTACPSAAKKLISSSCNIASYSAQLSRSRRPEDTTFSRDAYLRRVECRHTDVGGVRTDGQEWVKQINDKLSTAEVYHHVWDLLLEGRHE